MPTYSTLISVQQLQSLQATGSPLHIWDCSFDLMKPGAGRAAFEQMHLAGSEYVDLDQDLSDKTGAADTASSGRHPLPSPEKFAAWAGAMGVQPGVQVVVYDRNGCNYCGRAWWMLRWIGHEAVAVLDGGLQAWQSAGGAVEFGKMPLKTAIFKSNNIPAPKKYTPNAMNLVAIDIMISATQKLSHIIIDARAPARFRGEVEPLDPVAGHIPGALNRPFTSNFDEHGFFKSAVELKKEFDALLAGRNPSHVIHHCGSGVSAVPNLLAMEVAGYPPSSLFAGSWSEWSNTPGLPVAQG
jgi:thiosulfate/3-mercaptopyruvate sulfurtransferase